MAQKPKAEAKKQEKRPHRIDPERAIERDVPLQPSDKLARIVGRQRILPRHANRIVWQYVVRMGLQNASKKYVIEPAGDKVLADVLGQKPVSMFRMAEAIRKNLSA